MDEVEAVVLNDREEDVEARCRREMSKRSVEERCRREVSKRSVEEKCRREVSKRGVVERYRGEDIDKVEGGVRVNEV